MSRSSESCEERAPPLIIGADQDHTVPASVSKKQFKKYEKSPAQTDYLEFAGRPHLMMRAEIAGATEGWIASVPEKTVVAAGKASASAAQRNRGRPGRPRSSGDTPKPWASVRKCPLTSTSLPR